jgi:hypothetical protein
MGISVKTKFGLLAALMLWSATAAHAQNQPIFPGPAVSAVIYPSATPLGFVQIPLSTTAASLDPPAGATFAMIAVTGANATWRDDGQAPTPTAGMPILVGSPPIAMSNLSTLQFVASGSATLDVSFYK